MPPTIEDKPHVPSGVTEACLMNDHSMCNNPRCVCSCHHSIPANNNDPVQVAAGPEKACPKCGSKRPASETFCRVDGERLASLLCGMCGKGMNPEDSYCYNCGAPKGKVGPSVTLSQPKVVTVPEVEAGYEQQVLRGLQEELNVQAEPSTATNQEMARVVEQPGGTQGSFKLVSQPSPNRIRTPTQAKLRLPIKPS